MSPVTKDLTTAWQMFDDAAATAKENCLTALVGLVDSISEDLAGKWLHPTNSPRPMVQIYSLAILNPPKTIMKDSG